MSDLLIRNFDPPKYGYREIRIHPNGRVTEVDECGLDEAVGMAEYIPPHGRLIDASEKIKVQMYDDMTEDYYSAEMTIDDLLSHKGWVEADAPTIIPASE